jgi:hypothetical protein
MKLRQQAAALSCEAGHVEGCEEVDHIPGLYMLPRRPVRVPYPPVLQSMSVRDVPKVQKSAFAK